MGRQVYSAAVSLMVALVVSVGIIGNATAEFMFLSESAVFESLTGKVQFMVEFNQSPNFSTVDSVGRQANSFQYFILGDSSLPYPAKYDSIIRGDEIDLSGNTLPLRNSVPPVSDPIAGGWGALRGSVPFNVNGNTLTFSTPLSLISNHSLDGNFAYRLESYEFGALTRFVDNHSTVATEPGTGALMAMGGVALFFLYGWSRRRHSTHGQC